MKQKRKGRLLSGCLALWCLGLVILTGLHTNFIVSRASTFRGKNIWTNGSEVLHGRNRNWLYRWTDGYQMTFCISPRNHMGNTVTASPLLTNINDSDIPYIKSKEDYEKLAILCSWFDTNGSVSADNATYAAVQAAVWAIMEDGWESADSVAKLVDKHVAGTYERWKTLKEFVENVDHGGNGLPEWCSSSPFSGKPQSMTLKEGIWSVEFDISSNPQLAGLNWVFEGSSEGWSKSVDGGKMKFSYEGNFQSPVTVSAVLPHELKGLAQNTTSLNFFIPDGDRSTIQAMISSGPYEAKLYIQLSFQPEANSMESEGPQVCIYRHLETFISHYGVELTKSCAETRQPLEDAVFQVLEAFEENQTEEDLELEEMTPKPAAWDNFKICSEAVTDSDGSFSHTDQKKYHYSKTYCDGHPEPEYMEVPKESEDEEEDNSDEIEAIESANEELKSQWEALIKACEEETDFHGMEKGEGLEMMREDRDYLYEKFIHLKYDYTVRENQARYGYLQHGLHADDEKIPVIRMTSSEAGAQCEFVNREVIINRDAGFQDKGFHKTEDLRRWNGGGLLPEPIEDDVEWVEPSGTPDRVGYLFQVWDHRTEGEVHINKKDLELREGESQGDATLEGAVYGLYAASDICHPDGKTGLIYRKDDLTCVATTNKKGDASFLAYTEESPIWKEGQSDGKVMTWVGHPLILGQYYIKEIARSEGYELSVYGADREVTNVHTDKADISTIGKAEATTAMSHPVDMHDGSWMEFQVTCENTAEGYDLIISGYPEGTNIYRSSQKETTSTDSVVIGSHLVETGEYELAQEGEYKLDKEGNYIPLRDSVGNIIWDTNHPVSRSYRVVNRLAYYPSKEAEPDVNLEKWEDEESIDVNYVKKETNSMLKQKGYSLLNPETGEHGPWSVLKLSGATNQELIEEILEWFSLCSFWDSGAVHKIWKENGQYQAVVFHDYERLSNSCIYEEATNTLYLKIPIQTDTMGERHTFVSYQEGEFEIEKGYAVILCPQKAKREIPFPERIEEYLEPVYRPLYEQYEEGQYRLDGDGNRIPIYEREFIYGEKEQITSEYELTPLKASYHPETQSYIVHVENRTDWNKTKTPVTETFRVVTREKEITVDGRTMFYSDYLANVQGAGASAFPPSAAKESSYIRFVSFTYPGQISPMQDGEGKPGEGTRKHSISVQERIIRQTIQVTKDIKKRPDEEDGANQQKLENFRFCIYLKSNLERLYRDKEGRIVWQDQWGQEIDVENFQKDSLMLVPNFYTKGCRKENTDNHYKPILEMITVSMEDGDKEREVQVYNYRKFFNAIETANEDKWKDHNPLYTSHRPMGNERNRTRFALENKKSSDMVRQFAVNWYLEEEVKRLKSQAGALEDLIYGDERYDEALFHAIEKARDYLKPFFTYDLDQIYAIEWDSEENGGKDKDKTTLSADLAGDEACFGISTYLPYGTYVVVEQQPKYANLHDLPNRHYQIDAPKEVAIPSVYADQNASSQYPEEMSSHYLYDAKMAPKDMMDKYFIRFCEEDRVVNGHNHDGSFQIYPFGGPDAESHSESGGFADGVKFYGGVTTKKNPFGWYYKDQVPTMTGIQTAYDGRYSPVLVPWSLAAPDPEKENQPEDLSESSYHGFARVKFRNLSYGTRLRIEKLDSETHENILHDEAIFCIYGAEREESHNGTGKVKFYEKDTLISGSKEFLESMGAAHITPMARWGNLLSGYNRGPGNLYTGLVPAGTPICREEKQICMINEEGVRKSKFEAYATVRNGNMEGENGNQNTGYLVTPKPLEAGTYVLAEMKPPAGYVRTKPVAMEIYSDKVTYYKEGNQGEYVAATIYHSLLDHDSIDLARIYIENEPIKLEVGKLKDRAESKEVTWQISGRIDGSLTQIGNNADYEYAFLNGDYQGYAWKKGTLEYLQSLKEKGEDVTIAYHGPLFAGYGTITRKREVSDNENLYVAGAVMTLFEGLELEPSLEGGDFTYSGLIIQRAADQSVTRMYVKKGYAGSRTEFLHKIDDDAVVWTSEKTEREDTDILYYDFDKLHMEKKEYQDSIVVFRGGTPYLELAGGDLTCLSYSQADKRFTGKFAKLQRDRNGNYTFGDGTLMYHLDQEGNRDSLVDPDTGMAYVLEEENGIGGKRKQRVIVWPVNVARDRYGIITGRDKITTFRTATLEEGREETSYITGTWKSENGELSHAPSTNLDGQVLLVDNVGQFEKLVTPVLDRYGMVRYFQKSEGGYHTRTPLYDRNGDFVRNKFQDLIIPYSENSYRIGEKTFIWHRKGEEYILENSWVTGESSVNDPFHNELTQGQKDLLKRIPEGTYILEEVTAPKGYKKGFPTGITIQETNKVQTVQMVDEATKIMVGKIDGTASYTYDILDMQNLDSQGRWKVIGTMTEGKGTYSQTQLPGANLVLLNKKDHTQEIQWMTGNTPVLLEEIPLGEYLLEETKTPSGFIPASPVKIQVKNTTEVQCIMMYNDHTKVEVEKYTLENGRRKRVRGAAFHLYPAKIDSEGQIVIKDGVIQYEETAPVFAWESSDFREYAGFIPAFEEMYRDFGTEGEVVSWEMHDRNYQAKLVTCTEIGPAAAGGIKSSFPTTAQLQFRTTDGKEIRVTVYGQQENRQGRDFIFEYQFDYHSLPQINDRAASYLTVEGIQRFDYLPVGQTYVLVETKPPSGFAGADPRIIQVEATENIQRYCVFNQESVLQISKTGENGNQQLPGALLALYRAAEDGNLVQDSRYLVAKWISGTDGVYTETEQINHLIPEGYKRGDLRLHTLKGIPDGTYYLVELKAPDYYSVMEPMKFEYRQQEVICVIRAVNVLSKGQLEIEKVDLEGRPLTGAVFQLKAYRKSDLKIPAFTKVCSQWDGVLKITDLEIGEVEEDGTITPYIYRLEEVTPPEGYQVNGQIPAFEFRPEDGGKKILKVTNDKTRVWIQKKDFAFAFVEGADMAVYLVTGRDLNGRYLYNESKPLFSWTTKKKEESKTLEGLIAGRTYLLMEEKAPNGYDLMEPVAFTISMDGRRITELDNKKAVITFEQHPVETLTIHGRYGIKVEMSVTDSQDREIANWTSGGAVFQFTQPEGVSQGEICTITETTIYSDGGREVTKCVTKPLFWNHGICQISDRNIDHVTLELVREDGSSVTAFTPTEGSSYQIVSNLQAQGSPFPLVKNMGYVLKEVTAYHDGTTRTGSQIQFILNEEAEITTIAGFDKKDEVLVGKEDLDGNKISGAVLQILDKEGAVLEEWISKEEPYAISAVLEKGGVYLCRETAPPEGYGFSKDIWFTVEPEHAYREIVMVDRETKVQIQKTDRTGEKGLKGARLQIRDTKDQVIEEWISTESPYEITQKLTAGSEYVLHEEEAPKGYICAKDIRFRVPEDGSFIQILMKDEPTHVTIRKTDVTGQQELPGAWLQIIGPDKVVIEEWQSGTKPHEVIGKLEAGKEYVLHEKQAPKGHAYAKDIPFQVSEDGKIDQVVMKDKETHVSVRKTYITGETEVAGAILQILDQKGNVIKAWVSDTEPYEISGILNAGESYILHEEYAPGGYAYANDVSFTVSLDGRVDQVIMKDDVTKLEILKISKTSGQPLSGAKLQLLTEQGQVVEEWVTTETTHKIYGKLLAKETYKLQEISPPNGYKSLKDSIFVTIPKENTIVSIKVENKKKTGHPPNDTPNIQQPEKTEEENSVIGKVIASYKNRLSSKGSLTFGGLEKIKTPKTGDEKRTRILIVLAFWILSIIGMIGLLISSKRKKVMFLVALLWAFFPKEIKAEEVIQESELEITVLWDQEEPSLSYLHEGRSYDLNSCQLISVMTEERIEEVKDVIFYEAVEQTDTLPSEAEIQVTDEKTGQSIKALMPILDTKFSNWRWTSGFQFPIMVQQYDAGRFYLGDIVVEGREESPFMDYQMELLRLIDVNPEYYSIDTIQWISQPWAGDDGLVYRQAMATGQKYVADCHVVYGGKLTIPSVPVDVWQAVYKVCEETEETLFIHETEEEEAKETISPPVSWMEKRRKIIRITISLLCFLLALVIFLVFWIQKQKNCAKHTKDKK